MPILPCGQTDYRGKSRRTADLTGELAESVTESRLRVLHLVRDEIPDIRRSRRRTRTTKVEKILLLRKQAGLMPDDEQPVAVSDRTPRTLKAARRR